MVLELMVQAAQRGQTREKDRKFAKITITPGLKERDWAPKKKCVALCLSGCADRRHRDLQMLMQYRMDFSQRLSYGRKVGYGTGIG
jgi:hypothetical protein